MRMGKLGVGLGRRSGGGGDVTGPVVTDVVYTPGALPADDDVLTLTVSEACTLYAMHNTSTTPLTGAAIEAGAEVTQALAAGIGYVDWQDNTWGYGTFQLHIAVKDASGNYTVLAVIEHVRASPAFIEAWEDATVGDTHVELALLPEPWLRNASGLTSIIVTEPSPAPFLKACEIAMTTGNERYIERSDMTNALGLRTTEVISIKALVELQGGGVACRSCIGHIVDVGNLTTGIMMSSTAGGVWSIGVIADGAALTPTNTTNQATTFNTGDLIRIECEIDDITCRVRAYINGGSPGSWVERTKASAIVFPYCGVGGRSGTATHYNLYGINVAIGSTAPEV